MKRFAALAAAILMLAAPLMNISTREPVDTCRANANATCAIPLTSR